MFFKSKNLLFTSFDGSYLTPNISISDDFFLRFVADPMKDDPTPKQRITLNWSENGKEGVRNSLKIHNRVLYFKN